MARRSESRLADDLEKVEWNAYNESAERDVAFLTEHLLATIGVRMTAVGTGLADGRPVRSWVQHTAKPRPDTEMRLRLLYRVVRLVEEFYGPETTRAFLRSASPYLQNRAPLEVIADDDTTLAQQRVLGAVRAFLEG